MELPEERRDALVVPGHAGAGVERAELGEGRGWPPGDFAYASLEQRRNEADPGPLPRPSCGAGAGIVVRGVPNGGAAQAIARWT